MAQVQQQNSKQQERETPWSLAIIRKVGYGILVLALFDLITIFIPLRLSSPLWQFETMGAIVERVAVPLLGLVLVFLGEDEYRSSLETKILQTLRWLCLIVGVLFFLLLPLGVMNTLQVKAFNSNQLNDQYRQQKAQFEKIEQRLDQLKDQDLENFIKSQGRTLDGQTPQQAKEQFLVKLNKDKQQMQLQFEETKVNRRYALIKNAVKWLLGALVSGVIFIYIWHLTRWAL